MSRAALAKTLGGTGAAAKRTAPSRFSRAAVAAFYKGASQLSLAASQRTVARALCGQEHHARQQRPSPSDHQASGGKNRGYGFAPERSPNGNYQESTPAHSLSGQSKGRLDSHSLKPISERWGSPAIQGTPESRAPRIVRNSWSRLSRTAPSWTSRYYKAACRSRHGSAAARRSAQSFCTRNLPTYQIADRRPLQRVQPRKCTGKAIPRPRQGRSLFGEAQSNRRIGGQSCRSISGSLPSQFYIMTAWESQVCHG